MSNEQVSALIINQTMTQSYNYQPVNCDVVYHENSHKSTSSLYKTYNNQIFYLKESQKFLLTTLLLGTWLNAFKYLLVLTSCQVIVSKQINRTS